MLRHRYYDRGEIQGRPLKAVSALKTFHFEERKMRTSWTCIRSYAQKQKICENMLPWLKRRKSRSKAKRDDRCWSLRYSLCITLRRHADSIGMIARLGRPWAQGVMPGEDVGDRRGCSWHQGVRPARALSDPLKR
jgi:hypothetical protein